MSNNTYVEVGEKVSLRLSTTEDIPMVVAWRNKDRVRMNHVYRQDFTVEGQKAWMEKNVDTGKAVQFILCENSGRPVGVVHFHSIDKENGSAEYGIYIGEDDAIGKGYGSEAAVLALSYARDVLHLKKAVLQAFAYNTSAIKSYTRAGFVQTGVLNDVECSDGQKNDMIIMEKSLQ